MKKLVFVLITVLLLISGCGKYGKLRLPPENNVEKQKDSSKK